MGYIIITLKLIDLLHGVNQRKRHIQRKEQKLARDIFQSSTQAFTLPKTGCYEREKVEIKKPQTKHPNRSNLRSFIKVLTRGKDKKEEESTTKKKD